MADNLAAKPQLRRDWERRWSTNKDEDFEWSLNDVAPQLRSFLESGDNPGGRALDLGCGAGTSTRFLARQFSPSVGVDIALGAVARAAQAARVDSTRFPAVFLVADAVAVPFPDAAFGVVYDRGCLQNLPRAAWPDYFGEAARILAPGGVLLLLVSKMVASFPSPLSVEGIRARWAWYVRKRRPGPQFLTHDFLRRVRPNSLRVDVLEDFRFVTKKAKTRQFTHARFTRI